MKDHLKSLQRSRVVTDKYIYVVLPLNVYIQPDESHISEGDINPHQIKENCLQNLKNSRLYFHCPLAVFVDRDAIEIGEIKFEFWNVSPMRVVFGAMNNAKC